MLTACEQDQDGTSNGMCHTGLLTACEQDQDGTSNGICHTGLLTAREPSANLYDIYYCRVYVQRKTPDDRQRNCPKHIEFYSKNKFEKFVHLVGFIISN